SFISHQMVARYSMRFFLALVLLALPHSSCAYNRYSSYSDDTDYDVGVIVIGLLIFVGVCSIPCCIIACIYCARQNNRTDPVYANNYAVSPYAPTYAPYPPAYPAYPP
ncbi:hypothetical protein PFISCL1PPCAC_5334, partial [Pristionchus fissidentatus]